MICSLRKALANLAQLDEWELNLYVKHGFVSNKGNLTERGRTLYYMGKPTAKDLKAFGKLFMEIHENGRVSRPRKKNVRRKLGGN